MLNINNTPIIGAPKDFTDIKVFCKIELEELYRGAKELLSQGVPLNTPAAIPVGDLVRLAATMERYNLLLSRFVSDYEGCYEAEDPQAVVEVVEQLVEDGRELLDAPQPLPDPSPSSLIL